MKKPTDLEVLLTLLFVLAVSTIHAKKQGLPLIDSLLQELPKTADDTNKVHLLDHLSFNYLSIDPQKGLRYAQEALTLSKKLNWKPGLAKANADLGINYKALSEHELSLKHNLIALQMSEELENKRAVAGNLANISLVYLAQTNYAKTFEYAFKALSMYEVLGDRKNTAIILTNIGIAYFEKKDYAKTIRYYSDALNIYKTLDDKKFIALSLASIGNVHDAKGNYQLALEHHQKALRINKSIGLKDAMQINLAAIGYVYNHMENYPIALNYQLRALNMSEELGNKNNIAVNTGNLGETYYVLAKKATDNTNYLRSAIQYLTKAIEICREINYSGPLFEFTQFLSDAYLLAGNHQRAYETFKDYTILKDSLFSIQNNTHLQQIEASREDELRVKDMQIKERQLQIKELQIAQQRNEKILFIISIALLLVVLAIGFRALYQYRRSNKMLTIEKQKHVSLIEDQVRSLKAHAKTLEEISYMQAHDVRGPVATILGLVQLMNRDNPADPVNLEIVEGIAAVTLKLDEAVKDVITKKPS